MPAGAHPRSRGEHFNFEDGQTEKAGSSPLARGTPAQATDTLAGLGLIPARAGNTVASLPGGGRFRAHPRSRGEHTFEDLDALGSQGSSPLARGTPDCKNAQR